MAGVVMEEEFDAIQYIDADWIGHGQIDSLTRARDPFTIYLPKAVMLNSKDMTESVITLPVLPEEETMEIVIEVGSAGAKYYWLVGGPGGAWVWKQHIANLAYADFMHDNHGWPRWQEARVMTNNEKFIRALLADLGPAPTPVPA